MRYAAGRMETRAATADDLPAIEAVFRASAKVWAEDRPFLEANPDEIAAPVDLVNAQTSGVGLGDVIPLTSGAAMFIQETGSPDDTYFLESDGTLQALPAAGGDGAAPS